MNACVIWAKTCRRVHDHCCGVTRVDSLVVCPASAATPGTCRKGESRKVMCWRVLHEDMCDE